jgi:hypothetical protein
MPSVNRQYVGTHWVKRLKAVVDSWTYLLGHRSMQPVIIKLASIIFMDRYSSENFLSFSWVRAHGKTISRTWGEGAKEGCFGSTPPHSDSNSSRRPQRIQPVGSCPSALPRSLDPSLGMPRDLRATSRGCEEREHVAMRAGCLRMRTPLDGAIVTCRYEFSTCPTHA